VLEDGSMPPLRYRVLHWGSRLDDDEIAVVRRFTAKARAVLEKRAGTKPSQGGSDNGASD
jgi:hypothetical protein